MSDTSEVETQAGERVEWVVVHDTLGGHYTVSAAKMDQHLDGTTLWVRFYDDAGTLVGAFADVSAVYRADSVIGGAEKM